MLFLEFQFRLKLMLIFVLMFLLVMLNCTEIICRGFLIVSVYLRGGRSWRIFSSHFVNPENRDLHGYQDNVITCDVVRTKVDEFCTLMESACTSADICNDDDLNVPCFLFCLEQLRLACVNIYSRRYSSDLLRFAFLLNNRSASCYRILLKVGTIILPHASTLKRLSTVLSVEPGNGNEEQIKYLKLRASQLSEKERYVVLQLDEIHVNPSVCFKGGNISGFALNTDHDQAHTVQAFMVSSLFGKFKDIVSLTPVKALTSEQLTPMINEVLSIVQNAGFIVVVVVSDNNQVNSKSFQSICGSSSFEEGFDNPQHPGHKIFFCMIQFIF